MTLSSALMGCGSAPEAPETVVEPVVELPADWLSQMALAPETFATLTADNRRDGWVALHAGDLNKAAASFDGDDPVTKRSRARAQHSLAVFYDDLARIEQRAVEDTASSWKARGKTAPRYATLTMALHATCGEAVPADSGFEARAALHQAKDLKGILNDADKPFRTLEDGSVVYDPCVFGTASVIWGERADASGRADLGGDDDGLESTLFAPWLEVDNVGQYSPTPLDVPDSAGGTDDVQAAREHVRALTLALDAHKAQLIAKAGDDGKALLLDLGAVERFRQEWLTARARTALAVGRTNQALAYIEPAVDVTDRKVGPKNTPSTLAVLAEVNLARGRTRESLDSLQLLVDGWPEVAGLRELVGDLAVLQGLDRHGDSKEN